MRINLDTQLDEGSDLKLYTREESGCAVADIDPAGGAYMRWLSRDNKQIATVWWRTPDDALRDLEYSADMIRRKVEAQRAKLTEALDYPQEVAP